MPGPEQEKVGPGEDVDVRFPRRDREVGPTGMTKYPRAGLLVVGLASEAEGFFFYELNYTNTLLIDKQMCAGEAVLTSRSWIRLFRRLKLKRQTAWAAA